MKPVIWIPGVNVAPSHTVHNRPPKWRCCLCGHPFFEGEERAYRRHVTDSKVHDDAEIAARSPRHQAPGLFDNRHPDYNDIAWADWIEKNARERPEQWKRWMKTDLDKT